MGIASLYSKVKKLFEWPEIDGVTDNTFAAEISVAGRSLALYSFKGGTAFLIIDLIAVYLFKNDGMAVAILGCLYVFIAFLLNVFILALVVLALPFAKDKPRILVTILIMLLNLPIAWIYFALVTGTFITPW